MSASSQDTTSTPVGVGALPRPITDATRAPHPTVCKPGASVRVMALGRRVGSKIADLAVLIAHLVCAGCRRRRELYAEVEQNAKELHARLAPSVAGSSFRRTEPDPLTKQRILEQILATPRTADNGFTTWPRRRRRWAFTLLAVTGAVVVAGGLAAAASDSTSGPAPSTALGAGPVQPEPTTPGQRTGTQGPAHALRPSGLGVLTVCPLPPVGVRSPADLLLHLPDLAPIPMRPLYSHRSEEGIHVWHVYGPAGLATAARVRTTGVLPPLTTVELQVELLPDGRHRLRSLPCQPAPEAVHASAGAALTKDSRR